VLLFQRVGAIGWSVFVSITESESAAPAKFSARQHLIKFLRNKLAKGPKGDTGPAGKGGRDGRDAPTIKTKKWEIRPAEFTAREIFQMAAACRRSTCGRCSRNISGRPPDRDGLDRGRSAKPR
jgi:hypothetical protein